MRFFPGDRLHCPARISRGNGSESCRRPIEIDLPPQTIATVRVVAILKCYPGEGHMVCKRRSCRAQLAIRLEGVA